MRYIADQIGLNNPIERAFASREWAISTTSTNDRRQYVAVWQRCDGVLRRTVASAASPKVRSERGGVV